MRTALLATLLLCPAALAQEDAKALAAKGLDQFEQSCASDGWDAAGCEQAQELLNRALRADPENEEVELALAQARWNQALAKPKADPQRAAMKQQSLQMFQGLVQKRANVAAPTRTDARAFYELGVRLPSAPQRVQLLEKAVKADPRHTEAHRRLADVYLDVGRVEDAVKTYNDGIRVRAQLKAAPSTAWEGTAQDQQEALTDIRFAQTLQRKGKPAEAAKVLDTVLQATDDEPRTRRCLLFQSVDTRALGAAPVTGKVGALRPFCANFERINRAATLEKEGKVDEAIKELEEHQKEQPRNEESYLMLERLYLNKGEPLKATNVTRKFFTLEVDKTERCKQMRRLSPHGLSTLDPDARAKLQRDCAGVP